MLNIAKEGLHLRNSAYIPGVALGVPDIADVKAAILQKLHDPNWATMLVV